MASGRPGAQIFVALAGINNGFGNGAFVNHFELNSNVGGDGASQFITEIGSKSAARYNEANHYPEGTAIGADAYGTAQTSLLCTSLASLPADLRGRRCLFDVLRGAISSILCLAYYHEQSQ